MQSAPNDPLNGPQNPTWSRVFPLGGSASVITPRSTSCKMGQERRGATHAARGSYEEEGSSHAISVKDLEGDFGIRLVCFQPVEHVNEILRLVRQFAGSYW